MVERGGPKIIECTQDAACTAAGPGVVELSQVIGYKTAVNLGDIRLIAGQGKTVDQKHAQLTPKGVQKLGFYRSNETNPKGSIFNF